MTDPMPTDFRALCAELVDCLEKANWPLRHKTLFEICLADARAALAQPEPQGPTDEELLRIYRVATPCYQVEEYKRELDFARAVLARWGTPAAQPEPVALTRPECFDFAMDFLGDPEETEVRRYVEALEARAALLPEPVAPTDEELDELAEEYLDWNADGIRGYARAVLARWGRPAIGPVAVSERLPGPEDCDAGGRCWTGSNDFIDETGDRPVPYPASWELRWILNEDTHWLPHWALPVPGVEGKP